MAHTEMRGPRGCCASECPASPRSPVHSLPSVGGYRSHLRPRCCVLVCRVLWQVLGLAARCEQAGPGCAAILQQLPAGKGADAWHVPGAPQSPGFAACLGMGLHTNFPAKHRRTSARPRRRRWKRTSAPGGCVGTACASAAASPPWGRCPGVPAWGWHVPAGEGCDTHEPLRWPGNGLGRGW